MKLRVLALLCAISLSAVSLSAATFTVTSVADAGAGTLRQAIIGANAAPGSVINFNIAGAGPHTIALASELPDIVAPVTIDGWSQPGFAGTPLIEITGTAIVAAGTDGFHLVNGSDGSIIRGLVINGFTGDGIHTDNSDNHQFYGNWIGLDTDGTTAVPNASGGIFMFASLNNIVGGTGPNQRNVVGGNGNGQITSNGMDGTDIIGNYIGTDVTGLLDRGTGSCVQIFFSDNVTVGGAGAGEGNVIAGCNPGVSILGGSTGNDIRGNLIGVGADGTTAIPNSTNVSIGANPGSANSVVGNVIANSINVPGTGVSLFSDTTNVLISQNSFFNNAGLAIDLNSDGVTANDAGDPDAGENNLQNFPVLHSATESGGNVTIDGNFNSTPNSNFTLEFYASTVCDPSGFGEGQTYLGSLAVSTNALGNIAFSRTLPGPTTGFITATARDTANNTSEFSNCAAIVSGPIVGTVQLTSPTFSSSESSAFGSFSISRTGGTEPASVQYTITDGTATNGGVDYNALVNGTVTWAANDTATKFVSFNVINDALPEGTETFTIALSAPGNTNLGSQTTATYSLIDDDVPPGGTVGFASAVASVNEAAGTVTLTVNRTGGSTGAASVDYTTVPGSATAADYTPQNGTLNWIAGDAAPKQIVIAITDDLLIEGAENFTVALSNATGATLGFPATATVTINDDDSTGVVQFSTTVASVNEGAGTVTLTVTRTGGSTGAASVDFGTTSGSATGGTDYVTQNGTLNWVAGDATPKQIVITITQDALIEGAENFTVTLSNAIGATLGPNTTNTVTINDDDTAGTFAFTSPTYSTTEAAGSVTITVNRTGGSSGPASVDYTTNPGSATAADFTPVSGTLNWADGDNAPKSFVVSITNDGIGEAAESFTVTLSNPNGAALGSPSTATVTIDASATVEAVPAISPAMMLLLAVMLAGVAVVALRK